MTENKGFALQVKDQANAEYLYLTVRNADGTEVSALLLFSILCLFLWIVPRHYPQLCLTLCMTAQVSEDNHEQWAETSHDGEGADHLLRQQQQATLRHGRHVRVPLRSFVPHLRRPFDSIVFQELMSTRS